MSLEQHPHPMCLHSDPDFDTSYHTPSPALQKFINRTLRISITDDRFFIGRMMCTDRDRNVILSDTTEYRPPAQGVAGVKVEGDSVKAQLASRMIGLVVVPGKYITKIEVHETEGQDRWG
ncbi:Sm-like ribonucleo protein [Ascodesmis nigricans]|uniref:Sm-like ribonucleo protein n=1 Tax=Ascodesmis nigricans TaxID=341454 RepID=A0A4V3SJS4_9PEZI|nr:Sm-like ribonucleo protein [Ascodesmis nigricans]